MLVMWFFSLIDRIQKSEGIKIHPKPFGGFHVDPEELLKDEEIQENFKAFCEAIGTGEGMTVVDYLEGEDES